MTPNRITVRRRPVLLLLLLAAATAAIGATAIGANGREVTLHRDDQRFSFVVERDGAIIGFFTECSGIGSESEVVEFQDGSDPSLIRKLPGRARYGDVTLKRGGTADLTAWAWREQVIQGDPGFRADVRIRMMRWDGVEVASWQFVNAWPSKITGPAVDADGNTVAIEELVLVSEGMRREK